MPCKQCKKADRWSAASHRRHQAHEPDAGSSSNHHCLSGWEAWTSDWVKRPSRSLSSTCCSCMPSASAGRHRLGGPGQEFCWVRSERERPTECSLCQKKDPTRLRLLEEFHQAFSRGHSVVTWAMPMSQREDFTQMDSCLGRPFWSWCVQQ